jgi:hypothetical protein
MTGPLITTSFEAGLGDGSTEAALPGTGTSVPAGLDAILEYNGLFLGRGTQTKDAYIVKSISGLDDPDVRDTREPLPSAHGETTGRSLYGGRTIVINGRIQAWNRDKLRDMQQALRTAFRVQDEELPLYFRMGDTYKDHYIMVRKVSKIEMGEEQSDFNYWRPFQVTLRASNPRFFSFAEYTHTMYPNRLSNGNIDGSSTGYSATGGTLSGSYTAWKNDGTSSLRWNGTMPSTTNNLTVGSSRVQVTASVEHSFEVTSYVTDGVSTGVTLQVQVFSASTGGSVAQTFNSSNYSGVGLNAMQLKFTPTSGTWIQPIVRLTGTSSETFDVALDSFWLSRTQAINSFSSGIVAEADNGSARQVKLRQLGNADAQPIIRFVGPMTGEVSIGNTTNDKTMTLKSTSSISAGSYYEADTATRRFLDQDDTNSFGQLKSGSKFVSLDNYYEIGNNDIIVATSGYGSSADAKIEISYKHAWM